MLTDPLGGGCSAAAGPRSSAASPRGPARSEEDDAWCEGDRGTPASAPRPLLAHDAPLPAREPALAAGPARPEPEPLRVTDQPEAAATAYGELLKTPLAARGYRGRGLIAGAAGDFAHAAQELQQAVQLAPTDAATLSDLGYARLRNGDVNGARVPLMKAAELDQNNPKVVSNMVLYLLANGDQAQALAVMNQQKFTPDVRAAIRNDAAKVAAAGRALSRGSQTQPQQQVGQTGSVVSTGTVASAQGIEPAPRVLQRFAQ